MERMLRVMQHFTDNTRYTLDETARDLHITVRTLFRYISTFKAAGFSISRVDEGVYRLTTYNKEFADISQLVYFSREEAVIVSRLIENLSQTNEVKATLRRKLAAVYDTTSIGDYIENHGKDNVMETLFMAVKNHRQVLLKGYSSANSDTTKDYVLEPYDFTKEYVDVWAYDIASGRNKTFKIARMGDVMVQGAWEYEEKHEAKPIDSFRMSGLPIEHVKLRLNLRAKDLMTEEFPITSTEVYQDKRSWYWEGNINAFEGIGRFVAGLADQITVVEGEKLKAWLRERGRMMARKFR